MQENPTAEALLTGTFIPPNDTPTAIKAWIEIMQQILGKKNLQKVTGFILAPEFQEAFKKVKEFTSSSPSRVHYTLWKVVAKDKDLASFLSVMMSLPFMYGFTNALCTTSVTVMLEKSPGSLKIHQLRIIALLEADLNTALKLIFAKSLM